MRNRKVLTAFVFLLPLALAFCGCRSKSYAAYESCYAKLRQIDGAKQMWALEHHKTTNDVPSWVDLQDYLKYSPEKCPEGGTYSLGSIGELPHCSISTHDAYWRNNMAGR